MNFTYVKIGLAIALLLGIFYAGWHMRDVDFMAYKKSVEAAAKAQEAHNESVQKQHELVTKGISDEYDAKLNTLRNYYKSTSVWNNNGGSSVSGISTAPKSADVISAYNELASNCAQTTLMLVELQKWINEQVGIK
jgi:hypothetical protein